MCSPEMLHDEQPDAKILLVLTVMKEIKDGLP
jgi:hypothetical protein